MSDEQESYEDEFEQQPAPSSASTAAVAAPAVAPLPISPTSSHKPGSSSERVLTSPLSQRLSSRSNTAKTNRSSSRTATTTVVSPSNAAAQSAANNKRALALLETASNPQLVIAQLQEWNDGLQQQLTAAQASIRQLEQHHQAVVEQLHGQQRHSDEAASQLQSVSTQHGALKQQHTGTLTQLAKLEQSNVDLLAGQVKEKNARVDMEGRLSKCETALRREREDNARLRAEKKETGVQKRVEDEQATQQRDGWRSQNVELLTRIDSLDATIKQLRSTDKANLSTIQQLQHSVSEQRQTLERMDEELVTAIRRANEHADNAAHTSEQLRRAEEAVNERAQAVLGLERTVREQRDEIREKTDRITSVLFQMARIDEWKLAKEEEEREKAAVMMEMKGVVESQEKAMNVAMAQKDRSDAMVGILEERLGKEGKRLVELRDKQGEMERLMKGVVAALRDKEAEHDQLAIKYSHVSGKWTAEQQARQQERRVADAVEQRYAEAREEIDRLVVQLQRLEDDKTVREEVMKDRDGELAALKRKDEFYRKIQDMLASSTDSNTQGLLALLDSNNTQHLHYTNPQTKGRLKLALQSPVGQRLRPMLRRLEVESRELMDWSIEPQRLVDGLHALLMRVKTLRATEQFGARSSGTGNLLAAAKRDGGAREEKERGGSEREEGGVVRSDEHERELELVNARNAQLNSAVVRAEADKSKAVLRLVHVVAGKADAKPAADSGDSAQQSADKVFITQAETEAQEAAEPTSTAAPSSDVYSQLGLDALVLSELGLKDEHVELMLPALAANRTVKEVDLRGNALGNAAIVGLVEACLTAGNRVHMLDVQQNAMTLDGLEDLTMMLLRWSKQQQQQEAGEGDAQAEEKEAVSSSAPNASPSSACRIHSASLYRQGSSLLPILQLRLNDKLLLVDMRFNRLQHMKSSSATASSGGESVKQLMKRVLLRVCRVLNSVGSRGGDESTHGVDWDARNEWMTRDEVSALVERNGRKKAHDDRLKAAVATTFDTQYTPPPNRKTSDLDARNVNTVRPVLPPAPKRLSINGAQPALQATASPSKSGSAGKAKESAGLPSLSRGGSQSGSRAGSASGVRSEQRKVEEETKVAEPDESGGGGEAVVEGAVEASEDEYAQDDEYGAEEFGAAGETEAVTAE